MKYLHNTKAFTLIELLVAIAIFATISVAAFSNLRGGSPGQEIRSQANNLASLLRTAQVEAFSGAAFNGSTPAGGFGVHVVVPCASAPCSVIHFADVDNDQTYDAGTEEIETISLGSRVLILSSTLGDGAHDIIFRPPRPVMCFNGTCSGLPEQNVVLGASGSSVQGEVTLNQTSGQVSS